MNKIGSFIKRNTHFYLFVVIATLFIGIAFTSADFFTAPFYSFTDGFILFLQWSIIVATLSFVIYAISLNKYVFSILYPLICFFSSILMYFRYTTGTTYTTMILDAALDNDTQMTLELIDFKLILCILVSLVLSVSIVIYRFKRIKVHNVFTNTVLALLFILLLFNIPRIKNPIRERIPFNLYFVTYRYLVEKEEALKIREPLPVPTQCGTENDLNLVFILGESLRPDHLGFNGYERNTTPYLSKEDIISFPYIYSEETYTNASLPRILTRADSIRPDYGYSERSFIDIFKSCSYHTSWLANQEPAKSYVYFMNECDTLIFVNTDKSPYVFDKWTDESLLAPFKSVLHATERNKLIIMHTIGSHWYYNSHFTEEFQQFNPTVKSRIVSSNTKEEMINSYDNTILFTDYFIFRVIEELRDKNAIIIYLSDHGEALGEDGAWLHAADEEFVHYPACFVWMSPKYKEAHPDKYATLQSNREKRYQTDFLFHSIIGASGIESELLIPQLDIFK